MARAARPGAAERTSQDVALARLASRVAWALDDFAKEMPGGPRVRKPQDEVDRAAVSRPAQMGRGARQRQILALPGLRNAVGMKASEVGVAIGYNVGATTNALPALVTAGQLEQVPGVRPMHWRLLR